MMWTASLLLRWLLAKEATDEACRGSFMRPPGSKRSVSAAGARLREFGWATTRVVDGEIRYALTNEGRDKAVLLAREASLAWSEAPAADDWHEARREGLVRSLWRVYSRNGSGLTERVAGFRLLAGEARLVDLVLALQDEVARLSGLLAAKS